MTNYSENDEIDLKELFSTLWKGKLFIFLCVLIGIALASFYVRQAERLYAVTVTLIPVDQESSSVNFAGLGGLASLAGVSLPEKKVGGFDTFKALLISQEVSKEIFNNSHILQGMFEGEWDTKTEQFSGAERSDTFTSQVKSLLTGEEKRDYRPPSPIRMYDRLNAQLALSSDLESGFFVVSTQTDRPNFYADVIVELVKATDTLVKLRYTENGKDALSFYQQKIAKARSQEHREALARLIASEEQKLMLASRDGPYVAEIIKGPSISSEPVSPKISLIFALSIVLGGFVGCAVVLMRAAMKN